MKRGIRRIFAMVILIAGVQAEHLLADAVPVSVVRLADGFQLQRGGSPYHIKGAGLENGSLASLANAGGNSFRTWRTDNSRQTGLEVLDEAARHGMTVGLCIEIGRERKGFDYDDDAAVAAQIEYVKEQVLKYKDHPALLFWIIGNEPNLGFSNPRVFDAINDLANMIHEIDGRHPVTTALAGFSPELANLVRTRAPRLDFISIQMYGDIVELPRILHEAQWDSPYMVTEWGAIGHWEVSQTAWGAPIEQDSTNKAMSYWRAFHSAIDRDDPNLLGSYVFLWGQKQERTPTWYGMFLQDGASTQVVDQMHYLWQGHWPENRAPWLGAMLLDGKTAKDNIELQSNSRATASVIAVDPDGNSLRYRWEIMRESHADEIGGDAEKIPEVVNQVMESAKPGNGERIWFDVPGLPGAYRLFVYVYDDNGGGGHANIPFLVN